MKFNNKALPYPILDISDLSRTDYDSGEYFVEIFDEAPDENGDIKIEITHSCNIKEINYLIETEAASFGILLICPSTLVRKVFKSYSANQTLIIKIDDFCGKVEFIPQIIVDTKVKGFSSINLNNEYEGATFDLYPGDVLATAETESRYFKFESLKFESLISLRTNSKLDPYTYSVVLDESKVYIDMGESLRELWTELKAKRENVPLMVMSVYKDCFMIAIEELSRVEEAEEKRWAKSLKMKLDELGIEINSDTSINEINLYAQQLLESDTVKRLKKYI